MLPSHQDRWAISLWAYSDNATATVTTTRPLDVHSTPPLPPVVSPLEKLVQQFLPARRPVPPPRPLPAVAAAGSHPARHNSGSIFVSIASYRDSELPATVRSLVRAAHSPCRLRLGIVYQLGPGDEESCRLRTEHLQGCWEPRNLDNNSSDVACTCDICTSVSGLSDFQRSERFLVSQVRTLTLPHCEAKGPITARSLATGLYGGERYHLQVDSHMRFRPGWDAYLVGLLESVRATESGPERVCRPVLTTYPQGYHLPDCVPDDTRPTVLVSSRQALCVYLWVSVLFYVYVIFNMCPLLPLLLIDAESLRCERPAATGRKAAGVHTSSRQQRWQPRRHAAVLPVSAVGRGLQLQRRGGPAAGRPLQPAPAASVLRRGAVHGRQVLTLSWCLI